MEIGRFPGASERKRSRTLVKKYEQRLQACETNGEPAETVEPDPGEIDDLVATLIRVGNNALLSDDSGAAWAKEVFGYALTLRPGNTSASTGISSAERNIERNRLDVEPD